MCDVCRRYNLGGDPLEAHDTETAFVADAPLATSTDDAPSQVASTQTLATYLIQGYWNSTGRDWRRWDNSPISVNITDLTGAEQTMAINALNFYSSVANISFVLTSGSANIRWINDGSGVASTNTSTSGNSMSSATIQISSNWSSTGYMYQTYLHELGHAIGLGHQGPYNNSASYNTNAIYYNDTWQYSIMSYFTQSNYGGATQTYLSTAMMADIYALQWMYGQGGGRSGDTSYGFNANAGSAYDFNRNGGNFGFTIWDSGGWDYIDGSLATAAQTINLTPGSYSNMNGLVGNVGIAWFCTIEGAFGGSNADYMIGNSADNWLYGFAGNDYVLGLDGNDVIDLGDGNDTGYGGSGNDTIRGGNQNDLVVGEDGDDWLQGDAGNDNMNGGNGNDTMFGGDNDDVMAGSAGNDFMSAGNGNDYMQGESGNDAMMLSFGTDVAVGGTGSDIFYFEGPTRGTDIITDYSWAEGDVIVLSAAGFGIPAGFQLQQGLGFFWGVNAAPVMRTATVYFQTNTNVLWWDIDGTGPSAPQALSFLTNTPGLAATSFVFG